ncbi:MAG: decaprenyl-phosphate phosphoribosyltransferase [Candidatus Aminicenantes bacterium]|nr:decaprenyl-phosphate phosphoribosyltransferase [Candidatus Aminicenantes bacterium]
MNIGDLIRSLRPSQWTKNLFVFAALVFARKILDGPLVLRTLAAFGIFCLLSGSIYLVNDVLDYEEDRIHPKKSRRPIAAGLIRRGPAAGMAVVLAAVSLACAFVLNPGFFIVGAVYFVLQIAYSIKLKHVVILDVFIVASGFVLRVMAGGLVIHVPLSSWLLICTTLLALFIAMSKRRHELVLLEENASAHRPILKEYSAYLLDQMISVVTASTVIAYCLYTVSEDTVKKFGTSDLIYTTPFVLYGIFRYLYLVHKKGEGGSPEELILKDKPLAVSVLLWIATAVGILYIFK